MIVATPAMTLPSRSRTGPARFATQARLPSPGRLDLLVGHRLAADGARERPVLGPKLDAVLVEPWYFSPPAIWWSSLRGKPRIVSSWSLASRIRPLGDSAIIRPSGSLL